MLTFDEAVPLVVADRREGDARLPVGEALLDAFQAVAPDDVAGDDALAAAYRVVLARLARRATRDELVALAGALAGDGVVRLTPLQEFWLARAHHEGVV